LKSTLHHSAPIGPQAAPGTPTWAAVWRLEGRTRLFRLCLSGKAGEASNRRPVPPRLMQSLHAKNGLLSRPGEVHRRPFCVKRCTSEYAVSRLCTDPFRRLHRMPDNAMLVGVASNKGKPSATSSADPLRYSPRSRLCIEPIRAGHLVTHTKTPGRLSGSSIAANPVRHSTAKAGVWRRH